MNAITLLVTLAMVGAADVQADLPLDPDPTVVAAANGPADSLLEEAYSLFTDRRSWPKAARLLKKSAELRTADDPARALAFRNAGRIFVYVGDYSSAQRALEAAGDAAAERGAVAEAADAYLDAAHVAVLRRDDAGARQLIRRGALLARSPHLTSQERGAILGRIPAGVLAG